MLGTFYKPGLLEMILHGLFKRHSWFMFIGPTDQTIIACRICIAQQE